MFKALKYYSRGWLLMFNTPFALPCMLFTLLCLGLAGAVGNATYVVGSELVKDPVWSLPNVWLVGMSVYLVVCGFLYRTYWRYTDFPTKQAELDSGKNWLLLFSLGTIFWPVTVVGVLAIAGFSALAYDG